MNSDATVFVVDDEGAMRKSLCWLLESVGLRVEAYPRAEDFLESYDTARQGCLVVDMRMPGMSGLELQEELRGRGVAIPIIIISGYGEVPSAVRALKMGALDFVEKPFSDQLLLDRIYRALDLDKQTRHTLAESADLATRLASLTAREREVLDLVVAGKMNKVIAMDLNLQERTIEFHRSHIMKKMRVDSLAGLLRLVFRQQQLSGLPVSGLPEMFPRSGRVEWANGNGIAMYGGKGVDAVNNTVGLHP
jgi:FixJ family two-component response regulator